jgi:3-deoxy-D-manno-octulosonic-acid transferase
MRLFLAVWSLLWTVGLPFVLLYLWRRSRRDPDYGRHLAERFGQYTKPIPGAVWIHAVSLGELRSAVPLIRAFLARGEPVVTTHFTPAGRREAEAVFAGDIAAGRMCSVWIPFEFAWAYRGFLSAFQPRYGLVMEIEIWPRMIAAARSAHVPLMMCNAQYPEASYARDRSHLGLRSELMTGFAGALVKSDLQAARFASVGVGPIAVTGELRFDQPVPEPLVEAGLAARRWLHAAERPVVALASIVEAEEALFLDAIRRSLTAFDEVGKHRPLYVLVPRAPERFEPVSALAAEAGLSVARRSDLWNASFAPQGTPPHIDVLIGDSLGEMYAYLSMADRVVVGGGFRSKGSHNISEPLALGKPVMTGLLIQTIEYPAVEAISAGVCLRLDDKGLLRALGPDAPPDPPEATIRAFFDLHSGATARTLDAIPCLITSR